MTWDDSGFLLSKNRYNENSLIAEIYTRNHGKISGIIFGGTSKKIKNYLQIGNNLYVNFISKSDNKMGYFKIEIQEAHSPYYFDNQKKLSIQRVSRKHRRLSLRRVSSKNAQKLEVKYKQITGQTVKIQRFCGTVSHDDYTDLKQTIKNIESNE